MNDRQNPVSNTTAAIWGVLGVTGILVFPIYRLTPIAWDAIDAGMNPVQWLLMIASVVMRRRLLGVEESHGTPN